MTSHPISEPEFATVIHHPVVKTVTYPSVAHIGQNLVAPNPEPMFPVRTFRILGGSQIALAIICMVHSFIGVIIDAIEMNRNCRHSYKSYYGVHDPWFWQCWIWRRYTEPLLAFDLTCLICSVWFLFTGFFPICMSRKKIHNWKNLKIAFMVCSIIGSALFVPIIFSLGVIGAIYREFHNGKVVVLSAFLSIFSAGQFVVGIISASYCCCCSAWEVSEPTVIYFSSNQPGTIMSPPQTHIPGNDMNTEQYQRQSEYSRASRASQYEVTEHRDQGGDNFKSQQVIYDDPPSYKE
ncbi:uncharacterized protein LOC127703191 isoform X2 [Mytilus californianus]|nr:uncharacterized protein LOC127703191 isoform X2 [Mytilus californianus]